jgi:hypothetical protein
MQRKSRRDQDSGLRARRVSHHQPHGCGPTRFLPRFVTFSRARADDRLFMPVYFAGDTATRDFSSADIGGDRGAQYERRFALTRWLVGGSHKEKAGRSHSRDGRARSFA